MNGINHVVFAAGTLSIAEGVLHLSTRPLTGHWQRDGEALLGIGVSAMLAGMVALVPDIDNTQSKMASAFKINAGRGFFTDLFGGAFRRAVGGHRALTHGVFVLAAIAVVFGFGVGWTGVFAPFLPALPFGLSWAAISGAVTWGYWSHTIADLLTRDGVKLLWPVTDRAFHLLPKLLRFGSGSFAEYIINLIVWVSVVLIWTVNR